MSQYELIKKLKPWVTTFSEGIKLKYKHGDELCVGGKVKSIFDLYENLVEKDPDYMVQFDMDDEVGEWTMMVPTDLYMELKTNKGLKAGDTVIGTGKIYDPLGFLQHKTGRNNTPTVVCWKVEMLP